MLQELYGTGLLNLVYAGVTLISFIFALLSLLGAEVGELLDFDLDTDSDLGFISISPFSLAMFGATFGTVGLITRLWLDMDPIPSVLWATGIGLVIGVLAQLFFLYVLSPSKSSHFSLQDDAIGRQAEVVLTIPGQGIGEISFDNISGRVKLGARSTTGRPITAGHLVVIERVVGRVAMVRPVEQKGHITEPQDSIST